MATARKLPSGSGSVGFTTTHRFTGNVVLSFTSNDQDFRASGTRSTEAADFAAAKGITDRSTLTT